MSKSKKLFFSLFGVATLTAPLAATVSCGESSDSTQTVTDWVPKTAAVDVFGATDIGNKDDKSFNNQSYDVVRAFSQDNHFIDAGTGTGAAVIKSRYDTILANKGRLILAAGFNHVAAINDALSARSAGAYNDVRFMLIDSVLESPQVLSINFLSEQGAFLAGVAAAEYAARTDAADPKVMTYGGQEFGAVTSFMAGFQQGVKYYNDNTTGADVGIYSPNGASPYFVGNFELNPTGLQANVTQWLDTNGVDVIFPVAGQQSLTVAQYIKDGGAKWVNKRIIGVDTNLALVKPEVAGFVLTSVLKNIAAVSTAAINLIYGTSTPTPSSYSPATPETLAAFTQLRDKTTMGKEVSANGLVLESTLSTNKAGSLWGKAIVGGIGAGFIGLSNQQALFSEAGLAPLKTGAEAAALRAKATF